MIELDNVVKRYGSKTIIHNISFDVKKGEIVGFLGPNGAGKTATMRMIAGFTEATSGTVTVAGYDMATQRNEAAARLGYLPESPPLYDVLDVTTYLRFVAHAKGVPAARIPHELDRTQLPEPIRVMATAAWRLSACARMASTANRSSAAASAAASASAPLAKPQPCSGSSPQ